MGPDSWTTPNPILSLPTLLMKFFPQTQMLLSLPVSSLTLFLP